MNSTPLAEQLRRTLTDTFNHTWTETQPDTTWTAAPVDAGQWETVQAAADVQAAACGYPPAVTILDRPGDHAVVWICPGRPSIYMMCADRTVIHESV